MLPIIILAGGIGIRMGEVGKMIPKFLLPVNGEILLSRILRQAIESGHDKIIICIRSEYIKTVKNLLNRLEFDNKKISLHPADKTSILNSLTSLQMKISPAKKFILILGDIYYLDNPFKINANIKNIGDILIGKATTDRYELTKGGIIESRKDNTITRITKDSTNDILRGTRWSGMAICGKNFFYDLDELKSIKTYNKFCLENIFEYRNVKYAESIVIDNIDFVNINSPIHHTYANLLSLIKHTQDNTAKKSLSLSANNIRKMILKNGEQL